MKAKRAYEEGERLARERDRQEVEKRLKIAKELEVARQKQFKYKESQLAEQAKAERDEFLRIIEK